MLFKLCLIMCVNASAMLIFICIFFKNSLTIINMLQYFECLFYILLNIVIG